MRSGGRAILALLVGRVLAIAVAVLVGIGVHHVVAGERRPHSPTSDRLDIDAYRLLLGPPPGEVDTRENDDDVPVAVENVKTMVARLGCPDEPDPTLCQNVKAHEPTTADLQQLHTLLSVLDLPHVARFARPHDPAPKGSLVFAVGVRDLCVIDYIETVPTEPAPYLIAPQPSGRCLDQ